MSVVDRATKLAQQEVEEIEWVHGLAPMPEHLVELGTEVRRYTQELRLLTLPTAQVWHEDDPPAIPVDGVDYEVRRLDPPRTEVYVWGQRVR